MKLESQAYSIRLRELAEEFAMIARDQVACGQGVVQAMRIGSLQANAGEILIQLVQLGYFAQIDRLGSLVAWHTTPESRGPQSEAARLVRCPSNLFWEVCGADELLVNCATKQISGDVRHGVLDEMFTGLSSERQYVSLMTSPDQSEAQGATSAFQRDALLRKSTVCRVLAELLDGERRPKLTRPITIAEAAKFDFCTFWFESNCCT